MSYFPVSALSVSGAMGVISASAYLCDYIRNLIARSRHQHPFVATKIRKKSESAIAIAFSESPHT